jgi:hypothetical protein
VVGGSALVVVVAPVVVTFVVVVGCFGHEPSASGLTSPCRRCAASALDATTTLT